MRIVKMRCMYACGSQALASPDTLLQCCCSNTPHACVLRLWPCCLRTRPIAVQNATPSPVQLEIFKAVSSVFPSAALEQPACEGQLSVDIALRHTPQGPHDGEAADVKVAIECDGPHHFFINTSPHEQTLKTKLRNALLATDGWQVVLLDTYTWHSTTWHPDSATRQEVRHRFIIDLLKKNGLQDVLPVSQRVG